MIPKSQAKLAPSAKPDPDSQLLFVDLIKKVECTAVLDPQLTRSWGEAAATSTGLGSALGVSVTVSLAALALS